MPYRRKIATSSSPTDGDECLIQLMNHLDESSMIQDLGPLKLLVEEHDKFKNHNPS